LASANPKIVFLNYGGGGPGNRIFVSLRTSELAGETKQRLLMIARIEDNTVPVEQDTAIVKSRTFEISVPTMVIETIATPQFFSKPGLCAVYIYEVAEDFPIEDVKTLGDARKRGGKLLGLTGFGQTISPAR
ncbi:MAG: hypothetical protein WAM91_08165, partial [Candidatus Acidiferrales bacterium]